MTKMYDKWDPYDALVRLDLQVQHLTRANNEMAKVIEQREKDFDVLLKSHQVLQQSVLTLSKQMLDLRVENAQRS